MKKSVLLFLTAFVIFSVQAQAKSFESYLKSELATLALMAETGLPVGASIASVNVLNEQVINDRIVQEIQLIPTSPVLGAIDLAISRPENSVGALPVILMAGGFEAGKEIVKIFPRAGAHILVGFRYPLPKEVLKLSAQQVLEAIARTPAQLAVSLKWITLQKWANPSAISVLGVSLGTLFLPSALRIAEKLSVTDVRTILAFGGVGLGRILDHELKARNLMGENERAIATKAIDTLVSPIDPVTHLPFVRSRFLVIHATDDEVFSREMCDAQFAAVPEPKERVMIVGPHIAADKPEIIARTVEAISRWLTQEGALN